MCDAFRGVLIKNWAEMPFINHIEGRKKDKIEGEVHEEGSVSQ